MNIWILIYWLLGAIGLGIIIERHGKPKTGKENVWTSLLVYAIVQFLLYKAGLYANL